MPQQLTDEQWAYYQSQDYKARLADDLWNDPQLGREAKALVKKKHPNISIPDYDIEERVNSAIAKDREEREAEKKKNDEDVQKAKWADQRTETQKKYGFTDDGMKDLEKFMVDNNVGSYEVAASYRVSKEPKPIQEHFDNTRWGFDKQDTYKEIASDPEGWGRNEIMKTLIQQQERERGGR